MSPQEFLASREATETLIDGTNFCVGSALEVKIVTQCFESFVDLEEENEENRENIAS